jgi:hypothetical protein
MIAENERCMAKSPKTKKPPSAVFWGVYKITPEGLELVYGEDT